MADKKDISWTAPAAKGRKAYDKPTLTKGPALSNVSARIESGPK